MTVRSLGYRTDLLFSRFNGEVVDCGNHMAVRTPANPTYYWGNYLLFDAPPKAGDFERWRVLFAQEIGGPPEVRHMALGWNGIDGELGDVQPFLDAGFCLEESVVLATQRVRRPYKYYEEAEIRPISEEWEWEAALDNHVACRGEDHEDDAAFRTYATRKVDRYRMMIEAGLGRWFGAFVEGRLAGDLGLFTFEGLGRFQTVGTHPDFRRRGVCGALVHEAATFAFERMGAETLVMVADANYHAAKIYESAGFAPVERQAGLTWWERAGAE